LPTGPSAPASLAAADDGPARSLSTGTLSTADDSPARSLPTGTFSAAEDGPARSLPTGTFSAADDGPARSLRIDAGRIALDGVAAALGAPGEWTVDEFVATAYAWAGDRLLLDVVFVETPHRLRLVVAPAAGTFTSSWQSAPLGDLPLTAMRMPRS
jgi:hypothetical protein